jgi:NTP pyrophosphatase (non-canonical NTP hydrolase)
MLEQLTADFDNASRSYVEKHGIERDPDWFVLKMQEEMGELTQAWNRRTGRARAKGRDRPQMDRELADETADLLGHVLLFVRHNDIDLVSAIERKWYFTPSDG